MRDYKNVSVPRSQRGDAGNKRSSSNRIKRVRAPRQIDPEQRKRLLKYAAGIALMLLFGFGVWRGWIGVMRADLFIVSRVDVRGMKYTNERYVQDIVAAFKDRNIFRADLGLAVRQAVANPWVRNARCYRRLPNRIELSLTERTPELILDTGQGRWLMDQDDVVIERLPADATLAWPLPVIAVKGYPARPGEQVRASGLGSARLLLDEITRRGGWQPIHLTIRADSPDAVSVVYAGHEIKLGSGRYDEKLRRLAEVTADINRRGLDFSSVDLRAERQAAVMLKGDKGAGAQSAPQQQS